MSTPPIYHGELSDAALADPNNTHAILLQLVGNERDVLEIGCATGYMTRVMVERQKCCVTGFEMNAVAARSAKPYLQKLVVGNLENSDDLAHVSGQFQVIVMADVLEHLATPEMPLLALREHLSPQGQLIVSLPNVAHWSVRRALLLGKWELTERGLMDRTHLRWYTRQTASRLIESCGYHVAQRRASYVFPAHQRFGIGARAAVWAQRRTMPASFDDWFALQHIFVAGVHS